MPSAFRDEPFPSSIANGASGGPEWLTEIVTTGSGDIKANARWANPLRKYNVATGIKDQAGLADLIDFLLAVSMGRAYVFPFQDYSDYLAANQRIGAGDGATTAFQLMKTYTSKSGAFSYTRTIKLPQKLQGLKGLFDKFQFIRFYDIPCDADFADLHDENRCKLDPANFTETGSVTAVTDDLTFTATVTGARPAGGFDGGMITWTGGANAGRKAEVKSFANGGSGALVLWLPSPDPIAVGDTFSILMGCDKTLATCRDRYNNVLNHRGFPFVPGLDAALQSPSAT